MRSSDAMLVVGLLTVALPSALRGDEPQTPQPAGVRQYAIECWFDVYSSGKRVVVTAPKATISEGRTAMVRDVARLPRPGKTNEIEWLEEGTAIDVKVYRAEDGQRFLDAELRCSGSARGEPKNEKHAAGLNSLLPQRLSQPETEERSKESHRIRLVTTSARVVEPLKLGEKVAVTFGQPPYEHRFEVRVTEVSADVHKYGYCPKGASVILHRDPDWFAAMARAHPGRLVLGLDAREGKVAVSGWLETSSVDAVELALQFDDLPLAAIVYTDIARDGTLEGPNLEATRDLATRVSRPVIASGGVGSLDDIGRLAGLPVEELACLGGHQLGEIALFLDAFAVAVHRHQRAFAHPAGVVAGHHTCLS